MSVITWNQFKESVDRELKRQGNDGNTLLWSVECSFIGLHDHDPTVTISHSHIHILRDMKDRSEHLAVIVTLITDTTPQIVKEGHLPVMMHTTCEVPGLIIDGVVHVLDSDFQRNGQFIPKPESILSVRLDE